MTQDSPARRKMAWVFAALGPLVGLLGLGDFLLGRTRIGIRWLSFGILFLLTCGALALAALGLHFPTLISLWIIGTGPLAFLTLAVVHGIQTRDVKTPPIAIILIANLVAVGSHRMWGQHDIRPWGRSLVAMVLGSVALAGIAVNVEFLVSGHTVSGWQISAAVIALYLFVSLWGAFRTRRNAQGR